MLIELSDIIFAVDSIPAIFAVTSDPFIVWTSNIFAMLGLRAMYSLLADFLVCLKYLRIGLALVLVFVGTKMLVASVYKIPVLVSLGAVDYPSRYVSSCVACPSPLGAALWPEFGAVLNLNRRWHGP